MTVAVVTDSTADLSPDLVKELGITVVPLRVRFGDQILLDRVELDEEEFYRRLESDRNLPSSSSPTPKDFQEVYGRLAERTDEIISIHLSAKLSDTFGVARQARKAFEGWCRIETIDSQSMSIGLGMMVQAAARAAKAGASLREVAHLVRGMVLRTHVLFFLDTPEYLLRGGRATPGIPLVDSPNVKPVLKLEDGEVQPVEGVRTRAKALERLYEFVEDAPRIEELAVLYYNDPDETEVLLKRIAPLFPRERVYLAKYGPVLASYIGPGAMGVAVYEGEPTQFSTS